jgi:5-methylcytosine-specific restriction endonuclease McrA
MSIDTGLLNAMVAAGVTAEQIIKVIEYLAKVEEDGERARRLKDAQRKAKQRRNGRIEIPGELRTQVYDRDGWECVYCGADNDLTCDHVIPVVKNGETTLANLVTACGPCNSKKHDRDRKAFERQLHRQGMSKEFRRNPRTCPEPQTVEAAPTEEPLNVDASAGTDPALSKRLIDRESDRARAPSSLISPEAYALADECRRAVKATEDDYHGLDYQAQVWVARGYDPPTVVTAFIETASRYGPNKPMGYLAKAIDTACTRARPPQQRNLPLLSTIEGNSDGIDTSSFASFAASMRARRRKGDHAA